MFSQIKKYVTTKSKEICSKVELVGAFVVVIIIGLFITTYAETPYVSELAYIEHSINDELLGSVVPASCESMPNPMNHFANDCRCSISASTCTSYSGSTCTKTISYSTNYASYFSDTHPSLYRNGIFVTNFNSPPGTGSRVETIPSTGYTYSVRRGDGIVLCSAFVAGPVLPFAYAGIDRSITQPTTVSAPAGATAFDPKGGPITIVWTNTGLPAGASPVEISNSSTLNPSFSSLNTLGTYTFTLTVTDSVGLTASDSMNVTVNPVGGLPSGGGGGTPGPTGDIWADGTSGSITIPTGGSATITWDSEDTTNCRVLEGASQIATGVSNSVGVSVSPVTPTLYSLICDGTNGATDVLIDVVSINIGNNLPPDLSANHRVVSEGDGVNLTWNLNGGAGPCVLTANNIPVPGYSNIMANGGYAVPSVNVTTMYEIQCPNGSDSVRVEIIPRGFET